MTAPLIFPYVCTFATLANQTQVQDDIFREVARAEAVTNTAINAQVEPESFGLLRKWAAGRDIDQTITMYVHRRELENKSLLDANGMPTTPKIGDRLVSIASRHGAVIAAPLTPPGAYVEMVQPVSFGPGGINALYEIELKPRGAF